jgi:hypothetical protein
MERMFVLAVILGVVIAALHAWNYQNFDRSATARRLAGIYLGASFMRVEDPKAGSLRAAIVCVLIAVAFLVLGLRLG